MNVSPTNSTLHALIGQLNGVNPAAGKPAARTPALQQQAAAAPQKAAPPTQAPLNPNAPRGSYVNLLV